MLFLPLGIIYWSFPKVFYTLPIINHDITWYGVLFSSGFFLCIEPLYSILKNFFVCHASKNNERILFDQFFLWSILGILIGARLCHVLCYDRAYYFAFPMKIFKIWEGGLSSHGGLVALFVVFYLFIKRHTGKVSKVHFLLFCDAAALVGWVPTSLIRIGNFFNGELIGTPTKSPWAVIFTDLQNNIITESLHPVQLYESMGYLLIGITLCLFYRKRKEFLGTGLFAGIFLFGGMGVRFLGDIFKQKDVFVFIGNYGLGIGQVLSLPLIFYGLFILYGLGKEKRPCKSMR